MDTLSSYRQRDSRHDLAHSTWTGALDFSHECFYEPLGWFNSRFAQSFTVLTCCRMLHTLQDGAVRSKLAGVEWAGRSLDSEWHKLTRQAWAERKGVRFGVKVRQLADTKRLQETAWFIAYVQNELRLHR
jgi:hypothetical protein